MGLELLLTIVFILFILGLLVALIYIMAFIPTDAKTKEALAEDIPGQQQRVFGAFLLSFFNER